MKISLLLIFILAFAGTAQAQIERKSIDKSKADTEKLPAVNAPGDKKNRRDLMKDLGLSQEQKIKLRELRDASNAAKAALENNTSLSEMEKKRKLREMKKDQAENLMAILTHEQREKFKAARQNNP